MKKYLLAIDQGTTGSTALIVSKDTMEIVAKENIEFPQIFPKPSWVEHDLNSIFVSVKECINTAISKSGIDPNDISSIGITNQRETTCAYTKTGEPLANAIVWQDRRTADYCSSRQDEYKKLQSKTGLPLDPYFSGTKMKWLLENNDAVKSASINDNLLFSTIDTFLLYKLSGNESFKTDVTNASRTLLMNLESCNWDDELLQFFEINKSFLPSIEDSFSSFGKTKGLDFLPDGIEIQCILGDQQAALFGQGAVGKGDLKCTYGTGAFILVNTAQDIIHSNNGILTTLAYRYKDQTAYALEGSTYIAGAAVQWLRDGLKMIKSARDIEALANESEQSNTEDLFFFPFFTGVGAPYWKPNVKGSITGLTRGTTHSDIAKVCLEGITQSVCDSVEAMEKDLGENIQEIRVDGGACANNLLMQLQSNFSNKKIIRPQIIETTAFGVILGSLVSSGELKLSDVKEFAKLDKDFTPDGSNEYYKSKREAWVKSIKQF